MSEALQTGTLGFIGTGNLGGALVAGLLKAGYDVAIFDTDATAMAALKKKGRAAAPLHARHRR